MGAGAETFLTLVFVLLLVLGVLAFATRPLWKKIFRYFKAWIERDRLEEERERLERECRKKALEEISEYCHDDVLKPKPEAECVPEVTATTGYQAPRSQPASATDTANQDGSLKPIIVASNLSNLSNLETQESDK